MNTISITKVDYPRTEIKALDIVNEYLENITEAVANRVSNVFRSFWTVWSSEI